MKRRRMGVGGCVGWWVGGCAWGGGVGGGGNVGVYNMYKPSFLVQVSLKNVLKIPPSWYTLPKI